MAKSRVTTEPDPRRQRSLDRRRAYRLRVKIKAGTPITDEERAFFEAYEASEPPPRALYGDAADAGPEVDAAGLDPATDTAPGLATDSPPAAAPPPAPAAPPPDVSLPPPPPPPPRVGAAPATTGKRGAGEDWRDQYRQQAAGREATVKLIADQWIGVLDALAASIRTAGVSPLIEPRDVYGAIVLTLDDVLPDHLVVKPAHVAAGATTGLLVQRWMHREKIAEALNRDAHAEDRARAKAARDASDQAATDEAAREEAARAAAAAATAQAQAASPPEAAPAAPAAAAPAEDTARAPRVGPIRIVGSQDLDLAAEVL